MSDFDFDALRDPDDRGPDGRQRAAVDTRARTLRNRARRTRIVTGVTSVVAMVAIVAGVVAVRHDSGPSVVVEGPSTTVPPTTTPTTFGPSLDNRFIPPTTIVDGLVVLPVTQPDGETFTLRYPPAMKIAQLGFAGYATVNAKPVLLYYSTIQHMYAGAPVATFPGANGGTVSLFHANERTTAVGTTGDELAYQFGHWVAVVAAPAKDADRATWARSLTGTEDAHGYLVLQAQQPLVVGKGFEGGFGRGSGNTLQLASYFYCGQSGSDSSTRRRGQDASGPPFVSWCDGQLHLVAQGSASFVDQAENDLQVSQFPDRSSAIPPPVTTTTTTTAPVASSSLAVSASFVSPNQGFVLEQNGRVDATTDGGTTWTVAGSLPTKSWQQGRIRFIGPSDGFAFVPGNGPLLITHDAGATWTTVATPFADTFDLAILDGKIYAVGMPIKNTGSFGIWSTPVEHLVWKRDALSIPIGAGPIPTVQIVLSGTSGWIVENDRTVIAGARLQPNGTWAKWTPPCAGKNGPAFLAASDATDLVASCDEGVWGPPARASALYRSHDGGDSFTRAAAPAYGAIASASPNQAIIVDGTILHRSSDAGATWTTVDLRRQGIGDATDIGFTTQRQGFVVLYNGTMFMTHDAGATWTPVTLP